MKNVVSYYVKTIIDLTRFFGVNRAFRCALYRIMSDVGGHLFSRKDAIDIDGFKMHVIHNDIGISRELKVFKIHEPLAMKLFLSELRRGMYIVDVGSEVDYE